MKFLPLGTVLAIFQGHSSTEHDKIYAHPLFSQTQSNISNHHNLNLQIWIKACRPYERRRKFVTKIHADLVFSGVYLVFEVLRDIWHLNKKNLVYTGMLPCLVPSWPQIMQIRISFRSRSGC